MRILHVYKTAMPDSTGGIERVIHEIAKGCTRHGISSEVLFTSRSEELGSSNYTGYSINKSKRVFEIASCPFSISIFSRFQSLAKVADVIHYHFPWPAMDFLHFSRRSNPSTVLTYHSDIIRQKYLRHLYSPFMHRMMSSVDAIVATSENYLESSEVLKSYRSKVEVIPLGLCKSEYPISDQHKVSEYKKRFGDRFFLFIGVLRYYKGLHILLEAARNTGFPVVIVGAGPIELELKEHARILGLTNVHFLGFLPQDEKIALLQSCYSVVFPSHLRSEAFGVTLVEGAMFGKPLISSEIGTGTSFVNLANVTGLIVAPSDPAALRQAMQYLWSHPDKAAKMGANAKSRYENHFTGEQMVSSYVDLYRSLIKER
jgi:glycosyltransferase involved in cell wall biosynthesis